MSDEQAALMMAELVHGRRERCAGCLQTVKELRAKRHA